MSVLRACVCVCAHVCVSSHIPITALRAAASERVPWQPTHPFHPSCPLGEEPCALLLTGRGGGAWNQKGPCRHFGAATARLQHGRHRRN